MLASTVQFSRYGREKILSRRVPAPMCRSFDEDLSHSAATAPSAPKSVGAGGKSEVQATITRSLRTQQRAEADHPRSRPVPAAQVQLY